MKDLHEKKEKCLRLFYRVYTRREYLMIKKSDISKQFLKEKRKKKNNKENVVRDDCKLPKYV